MKKKKLKKMLREALFEVQASSEVSFRIFSLLQELIQKSEISDDFREKVEGLGSEIGFVPERANGKEVRA